MAKKESKEPEQVITDILETYFKDEEGVEMVKREFYNKEEKVGEEIVKG